uniref:Venom toxin n=1 Tax=Hemiscorpius lepturus TaxID=520031 RepID=A0A1L4BJ80_HEMLE|nr:venom toxin [Hemiscorpius lepturus]
MQILDQTEAGFWGKVWDTVKNVASKVIGKQGLRNLDQLDDLYDSDLSDVKLLEEFFK